MNKFNPITQNIYQKLTEIVGEKNIFNSLDVRKNYASDWTEDFVFPPEVVIKPISAVEISEILKLANQANFPVYPIGGKTGLSGGMLPVFGGVGLSLERMNQILDLDIQNLQITVQPGVITQHIMDAAAEKGLYYPPDPSSKGSCFIGGNLAESAGGAHAVKYGITKDYVLALEVVMPSGEIINTGAKVLKNSTGYNLTQLLVGSEGTLGIITKATLKLIPMPKYTLTIMIPFEDAEAACDAVSAILNAKIVPCVLEFIEIDAIHFGQKYLNTYDFDTEGVEAHLLVELDGNNKDVLYDELEEIYKVIEDKGFKIKDMIVADSFEQQNKIWKLRRCLGEAVKGTTVYKEEDTVVPRANLAKLLKKVKEVGKVNGFKSVCYGHAGDGNLHINIIKEDLSEEIWNEVLPKAIREIFEYTVQLGGTLSGEHGVGFVQKNYMDIAFSNIEIELMKSIKKIFDPNGILNPGKIFPD